LLLNLYTLMCKKCIDRVHNYTPVKIMTVLEHEREMDIVHFMNGVLVVVALFAYKNEIYKAYLYVKSLLNL